MKRKMVLLIVLALVLAGSTGLLGLSFQNASAATSFQRVNFVTGVVTADFKCKTGSVYQISCCMCT